MAAPHASVCRTIDRPPSLCPLCCTAAAAHYLKSVYWGGSASVVSQMSSAAYSSSQQSNFSVSVSAQIAMVQVSASFSYSQSTSSSISTFSQVGAREGTCFSGSPSVRMRVRRCRLCCYPRIPAAASAYQTFGEVLIPAGVNLTLANPSGALFIDCVGWTTALQKEFNATSV